MSLEDQVARLANAIGMHDDEAIKEIIRQRDDAYKQRDRWKRDADFYQKWSDENFAALQRDNRRVNALKGVITKMKKKSL